MHSDLIDEKIDSLARCIQRIEDKRPASCDVLRNDLDIQDIISINLERAVQQCVDVALCLLSDLQAPVPATMAEAFEMLRDQKRISPGVCERMIRAVGFRNVAVHAYRKIDWEIVWNVITNHLEDFRSYAREVVG